MSLLQNLLLDDDVRHPLIAENPDWEQKITPALVEMGTLADARRLDLNAMSGARILRVLLETVYVMGYQSAKEEPQ